MYTDAPFGYELFPHDQQITLQGLTNQSKQFDAINTKESHVWIVIHKVDDIGIVKEAMTARGYQNLQNVYWIKPDHYVAGPIHRLTPVVEVVTFGCLPNAQGIHWNVSEDPRQRPNVFSCKSVGSLARDSSGNVINVTEKPPELAKHLLGMFCKKGGTVLIVGTGAGGCVKGALEAGLNVIGVENDEKQYNQLYAEMNAWVGKLKKAKEPVVAKQPKAKKPSEAPAPKDVLSDAATEPAVFTSVVPAVEEGICFSCDQPGTEGNPLLGCAKCYVMNHVNQCMTDVAVEGDEDAVLVCNGCKLKFYAASDK